jgi:Oxidoreductase-like protein, N-terminal
MATTDTDPQPEPPREPALDECCGTGCDPCVFDVYADALSCYRTALAAWKLRRRDGASGL